MSVLDSILKLKQIEKNEDILDQQTMASFLDTIVKSKQVSDTFDMEKKKLDVSLAGKGLKWGDEGLERAPELESPLDQFEQAGKAAKAKGLIREESILADVEAGRTLTPGKQKIYKETITKEKEKKPSFGQEQKIAALKSGIKRGRVVIGKEWGEPEEFDIETIDDVYRAIELSKLDPSLFEEELKRYEEVIVADEKGNQYTLPMGQLEQALKQGYKRIK